MPEAKRNLKRLDRARRETAILEARGPRQKNHLRLLRSITEVMEMWIEPGREEDFEIAWKAWLYTRGRFRGAETRDKRGARRRH